MGQATSEIKEFKNYMQIEQNLSPNSVEAYMNDIHRLYQYLAIVGKDKDIKLIRLKDLQNYLLWLS